MNALVTFRTNGAGTLGANPAQREEAWQQVTSLLRTKLLAVQKAAASAAASTSASATATSKTLTAATSAPANAAKSATAAKSSDTTSGTQTLDRDAFLQLLVTQMQNQDPLSPMDNTEMIAQLAQFSALEQMNNLNESFETMNTTMEYLTGNVDQLNFISAQGMLGKWVRGINVEGTVSSGIVESVTLNGSIVILTVDGKVMPMTGVLSIATEAPAEEDTTTTEKKPS